MSLESETHAIIEIKDNESSLTVCFLDRIYSEVQNHLNDKSVTARIGAVVRGFQTDRIDVTPGFQGEFEASMQLAEIQDFRENIARLHQDLRGEAEWRVAETLLVSAQLGVRGDVNWEISLHYPGDVNALQFMLWNDQSYLPALLRQIDAVFAAYPLWQG